MNKTVFAICILALLSNVSFAQTTDTNSTLTKISSARFIKPLPICRCRPRRLCPDKYFSHNGRCPCPTIQSGTFSKGYWQTGDIFETGLGGRTHSYTVTFPRAFCKVPFVSIAVNHLDSFSGANLRYQVYVTAITQNSFVVHFNTWADTKIYGLGISYIAYA